MKWLSDSRTSANTEQGVNIIRCCAMQLGTTRGHWLCFPHRFSLVEEWAITLMQCYMERIVRKRLMDFINFSTHFYVYKIEIGKFHFCKFIPFSFLQFTDPCWTVTHCNTQFRLHYLFRLTITLSLFMLCPFPLLHLWMNR